MSSNSPSPFDPKSYYRFSNAEYAGVTISTGYKHSSASIILTPSGSRSSENWQIYRQTDRYFVRNYDYGADLQLGLMQASDAVPQLLPRSGELGQQWMLDQAEDGSWRMTNAMLGNVSWLGVSDAISSQEIAPGMNPSPDESERWIVTVNLSAGEIEDQEMLSDVVGLEISPDAASVIPSAAPTIPTTDVASTISALAATSTISSTVAASTISSTATSSSECCGVLPASTYSSEARPMHSPLRFSTCTLTGSYVMIAAVMLSLIAVALLWRRRSRNSYHCIVDSHIDFREDVQLVEK